MDINKLDKWENLLLDIGKRNNLINFKETKSSYVEILCPDANSIFSKIDSNITFEVIASTYDDIDDSQSDNDEVEKKAIKRKDAFYERNASKIKKQNQLLLFNQYSNEKTCIANIKKKDNENIEETGVNVAYIAFGFIRWKEKDYSEIVYNAPVLLVPIEITSNSLLESIRIKFKDDEVIVNPTFSFKLQQEYNIQLPEYEEQSLSEYLTEVRDLLKVLKWEVTEEAKIGIFSFLKLNMYRDIHDNKKEILKNKNIKKLLNEAENDYNSISDNYESFKHLNNPLIELHNVIDADSSQIEAIEMAKSGKSFVLQGPPGTGKSQTITNIIAECLADGKKVLFVSEKLAALNVVYEKLDRVGLSEFCLQLHSHKANKKDVIDEISKTLNLPTYNVSSKADEEIKRKESVQKDLDEYDFELHKLRMPLNCSLYQLYEKYYACSPIPDVDYELPHLSSCGDEYLNSTTNLLRQYSDYIPSIGHDFRRNSWYGYTSEETSYSAKNSLKASINTVLPTLDKLSGITKEIEEQYDLRCNTLKKIKLWSDFFASYSKNQFFDLSELRLTEMDNTIHILKEMEELSAKIIQLENKIEEEYEKDIYQIDSGLYKKKLSIQYRSFISRLFSSEYKSISNQIRLLSKTGNKLKYNDLLMIVNKLYDDKYKNQQYMRLERNVENILGSSYNGINTNWSNLFDQLNLLKSMLTERFDFSWTKDLDFKKESNSLEDYHHKIEESLENDFNQSIEYLSNRFDKDVLDVSIEDFDSLKSKFEKCLKDFDRLNNWCNFHSLLVLLKSKNAVGFLQACIDKNIDGDNIANAFKKNFYLQWINEIYTKAPILSRFSRIPHQQSVSIFKESDLNQLDINKAKIRSILSSNRPGTDIIAPGSALSLINREANKKRKLMSTRNLLINAGKFIQRIKPCFLMSPLSVSTYLEKDAVKFDVVIFDEASQIFPQDAIGSIYRAEQAIIVGDSKQMPPTNFFNASVEYNDLDEEEDDITDFESILDLCSSMMPQRYLNWHYRSRYEQLIAFSNKNYYNNRLLTFPSSTIKRLGIGVDYYHVDGIFDRKSHTNLKEAEFVVDLIFENIKKYPKRSLGVVAFNISQQRLIEKLILDRRKANQKYESFFDNENMSPFFVKNLETVQGDERDTIILDVAYGKDEEGRLLLNFGPLNKIGGERRLNVAITRARSNTQVVSSMHAGNIDLSRTSSRGATLLHDYLDYAENGRIALSKELNVSSYDQYDSDFEKEVCDFLRSKGYFVDTQVGCSGYRIDMGLKKGEGSNYVLAIECDGATYHSFKNARDRDRLRQQVLENMGWKFYRIWSTDWFENKSVEKERLLSACNDALNESNESNMPTNIPSAEPQRIEYETSAENNNFDFPEYHEVNLNKYKRNYYNVTYYEIVKEALEVESPLSEEWLLKRTVWYFHQQRATAAVKSLFEEKLRSCIRDGISRRGGFLYKSNNEVISFRKKGKSNRTIDFISTDELAAGMLKIIELNGEITLDGLFKCIAEPCGVSRITENTRCILENAYSSIRTKIKVKNEFISLK